MRFENENLDHATRWHESEDNREEWEKDLGKKIKIIKQCKKGDEEEKLIIKEILNDASECFDDDDDCCANQQLIGHEDLFRGEIANIGWWMIEAVWIYIRAIKFLLKIVLSIAMIVEKEDALSWAVHMRRQRC